MLSLTSPLILHSPFIANGSSSRALLLVLVRSQSIQEVWEDELIDSAALYSVGGIRTTFTIGVGAGGPAAYWWVNVCNYSHPIQLIDGLPGQAMS